MIESIAINDPNDTPITWWGKNKTLQNLASARFSRGLNILWGKNGSGKSSLLAMIAKLFHAEQSRYSVVTHDSITSLWSSSATRKRPKGVDIVHDGQGVAYFDPQHKVGLIGGLAGFDYDFLDEGLGSIFTKGSSGQLVTHELGKILSKLKDKNTLEVEFKTQKGDVNSLWYKRIEAVENYLKPSIDKGPITLLLDEPDRSLDLPNQKLLWRGLRNISQKYQLIVASHSPFAANVKDAVYIELSDGYLTECREALKTLGE